MLPTLTTFLAQQIPNSLIINVTTFFPSKMTNFLNIFGPSNTTELVTLLNVGQGSGHLLFSHYFFAEPLRSRIAAMLRTSMVGVFSISTLSVKA